MLMPVGPLWQCPECASERAACTRRRMAARIEPVSSPIAGLTVSPGTPTTILHSNAGTLAVPSIPGSHLMRSTRLAACILLSSSLAHSQEWPRFRGANGSGVLEAKNLPVSFGPEENLRWRADVPYGASSPILTESAVIVTGSDEDALLVMAIARDSGEELWARAIEKPIRLETYESNDSASPSPVTDGQNIYVFFPELGLISFDEQGEERWRHPLGPFVSFYGMSSSPVLAGDVVVLLCDQQADSFIVGVDAATGKQRWRTERPGIIECWTTPVVHPAESPEQVIVFGSYFVTSHSVQTGEELWRMKGFGYTPVCSPILSGDMLFVSVPDHSEAGVPDWAAASASSDSNKDALISKDETSGEMRNHFGWMDANKDDLINEEEWNAAHEGMNSKDFGLAAIDLSTDGVPTEVWRYKKSLPSISSPLLYEGVLYLARDGGLVTKIDAANGEVLARERLPDSNSQCWPSPVAAGGKIYVANNAGQVAVVEAGAEWKVLKTNDLGEDCMATPALGKDGIFVRTRSAMWAFGGAEE